MVRQYKKIGEAPEGVAEILAIVRLLPAGQRLIDCFRLYSELCDEDKLGTIQRFDWKYDNPKNPLRIDYGLGNEEIAAEYEADYDLAYLPYHKEAAEICLDGLPSDFLEYINPPTDDRHRLYEMYLTRSAPRLLSYEDFDAELKRCPHLITSLQHAWWIRASHRYDEARMLYIRTYSLLETLQSVRDEQGDLEFRKISDSRLTRFLFSIDQIEIDNGILHLVPSRFTSFQGIDANRLRICGFQKCNRVFWASRFDQQGCSTSCAKALRTRKWRDKVTPEQKLKYKINRIKKGE